MPRIALISPTHLACNPRLVKEADALAGAGHEVDVFYCQFMADVVAHDHLIEQHAAWRSHPLNYVRVDAPATYWTSRLRQHVARKVVARTGESVPNAVLLRAYERMFPELRQRVAAHPADLYIAHNLQALPVAHHAAQAHGARLGFDAEDFHTGMFVEEDLDSLARRMVVAVEERFIRTCDYVTAAAPHIAEAYAQRYDIDLPTTVLNTFPSSMRPESYRPTHRDEPITLYWFSQTIGPVRGLEDAARALSYLDDITVELHLRGRVQDPDYLNYLRMLAGPSADRILVHGVAPADEMIRLAAQHDVGLALEMPVKHNRDICLSNKIFSYLAAGNAVVASGTTGQRALMDQLGPVGAVYAPGDARVMALVIRQWHESRAMLDRCRRRAWQMATDHYNWEVEAKTFLGVVDGLFGLKRTPSSSAA